MSRSSWKLLAPAFAVWAVVTAGVVLQWHVRPSFGDGDCGTVWTVVTGRAGLGGCTGPGAATLVAGTALTSVLFLVPAFVAVLVSRRRGRAAPRRPSSRG